MKPEQENPPTITNSNTAPQPANDNARAPRSKDGKPKNWVIVIILTLLSGGLAAAYLGEMWGILLFAVQIAATILDAQLGWLVWVLSIAFLYYTINKNIKKNNANAPK